MPSDRLGGPGPTGRLLKMDFSISEEEEAIRDLAHQIFSDGCAPEHIAEIERDESGDGFDHALYASLAESHLLGVALPEKFEGSGYGLGALLVLLEEAGRAVAPLPLLPVLAQAAPAIQRFGTDGQREQWLPGIAKGQHILTVALDELGSDDPAAPATTARPDGDVWRLDGEKICVTAASSAKRILVPARTEEGGLGLFLVDPRAQGVELEESRASDHGRQFRVVLRDVAVEADGILGDPQSGPEIVESILNHTRIGVAALQIGVSEEALRRTAEYTATRKQFGRAIGTFQAVTMRSADGYIDIESMRSTLWQAAWRLENDLSASQEASAAAWWACEGAHRVVHTAQHLHGGMGADIDYPIHRYFLRATQLAMTVGGAGRQIATIGGNLAAQ